MAFSMHVIVALLALYGATCCFLLYFCVLADPGSSQVAYFMQVALPDKAWSSLSKVMGEKRMNVVQSVVDLFMVIVYFFVVLGCWTVVFWFIYPWIRESSHVGNYHQYVGYVVCLACFGSWRLVNKSNPGIITARSFPRYDHYPYDHLMFVPNRRCDTTHLIRIPRSKFDRLKYNQNIPRYDHYCGWVYNTIGEENYRWFLLFLLIHVLMCGYGSTICLMLFWGEIMDKKLLEITFFDRSTGEHVAANIFIVCQYLFMRKTLEFAVLAIVFVMGIAVGAFLGYHIHITSHNRTTNEDGKWSDIRKWYTNEQKKYQTAVQNGWVHPKTTTPGHDDETAVASSSSNAAPEVPDGDDVGCTGGSGGGAGIQSNQPARSSEYIDPGPVPKNMYDRGFVENWKEVLFPISLRKEAIQMGGYSKAEAAQRTNQPPPPDVRKSKKPATITTPLPTASSAKMD